MVYDAVGLDTYVRSMNSLRPRGLLALYGEASGLVPPIDPRELLFRESLYLTRTGLDHYIADRRELMSRTNEIFTWMAEGRLNSRFSAPTALTKWPTPTALSKVAKAPASFW